MNKLPVPDRRPWAGMVESAPKPTAGERMVAAAKEVGEIARGEREPANGHKAGQVLVGVWMPDGLAKRLDAARGGSTRPQAIRDLLEKHLP